MMVFLLSKDVLLSFIAMISSTSSSKTTTVYEVFNVLSKKKMGRTLQEVQQKLMMELTI